MQPLVSYEWATTYFDTSRPKANEWTSANETERLQYLNWAGMQIKSAFVWQSGVDIANDDRIRIAICEQALWLMRRPDVYPEVLTKGLASGSVGGGAASATFSKEMVAPLICEEAKLSVGEAGSFIGQMATIKTMPLGW